jgi:hypothetical protein
MFTGELTIQGGEFTAKARRTLRGRVYHKGAKDTKVYKASIEKRRVSATDGLLYQGLSVVFFVFFVPLW